MASQTYTDSVTLTSAAEFNKFDTAAYAALSGVAGTNTITATGPANLGLVATNPVLWFIPAVTNTGATTLNITPSGGAALGAKNVFSMGSACVGGELVAGVPVGVVYDGTQYNLIGEFRGVLQAVEATPYTTHTDISTVIAADDSIPQNNEGTQIITVSITPKSSTNRLRIEWLVQGGKATAGTVIAPLFQDNTANALAVSYQFVADGAASTFGGSYEMAAGTTSSTTFKVRVGVTGGNFYTNGTSGGRLFGGVSSCRLRVTEIKA